ncbi:hypothetical protein [Stigmatella aurantiaca]|nr:hypothetical protein [Stigmatella aurantiaca]
MAPLARSRFYAGGFLAKSDGLGEDFVLIRYTEHSRRRASSVDARL